MKRVFVKTDQITQVLNHYHVPSTVGLTPDVLVSMIFATVIASATEQVSDSSKAVVDVNNSLKILLGDESSQWPWMLFNMAFNPTIVNLYSQLRGLALTQTIVRYFPVQHNGKPVGYFLVELQ